MPSPFPGMDPYLESPEIWSDFHASLAASIQAQLALLVGPEFFVRAERRVYILFEDDPGRRTIVPDVAVVRARTKRPGLQGSRGIRFEATRRPPFADASPRDRPPERGEPNSDDRVGYDLEIDYSHPPDPPLDARDRAWARRVIGGRGRK